MHKMLCYTMKWPSFFFCHGRVKQECVFQPRTDMYGEISNAYGTFRWPISWRNLIRYALGRRDDAVNKASSFHPELWRAQKLKFGPRIAKLHFFHNEDMWSAFTLFIFIFISPLSFLSFSLMKKKKSCTIVSLLRGSGVVGGLEGGGEEGRLGSGARKVLFWRAQASLFV